MSDPAWTLRTVLGGAESIVYIQEAGTVAAPGTADELGFITAVSFGNEATIAEKGPYVNSAQVKKTTASYSGNAEVTVDVADGADTARDLFFDAIENLERVKITIVIGDGTTGEKHVYDEGVVGFSGEVDPASGTSYTFTIDADSYAKTNATA
jgi:hypothetical protein